MHCEGREIKGETDTNRENSIMSGIMEKRYITRVVFGVHPPSIHLKVSGKKKPWYSSFK